MSLTSLYSQVTPVNIDPIDPSQPVTLQIPPGSTAILLGLSNVSNALFGMISSSRSLALHLLLKISRLMIRVRILEFLPYSSCGPSLSLATASAGLGSRPGSSFLKAQTLESRAGPAQHYRLCLLSLISDVYLKPLMGCNYIRTDIQISPDQCRRVFGRDLSKSVGKSEMPVTEDKCSRLSDYGDTCFI
jgi:hypothetical protein